MLLGEVERVLSAHGVSRQGAERVLVACSGGLDSVVLASAAAELLGARRVTIGHVDHAAREGSASDSTFVTDYARAIGVQSMMTRLEPGAASEERLRDLRYAALEDMRARAGAAAILVAHTEDDQAETVLLGLLRSTRPDSLRGMPVQRGAILRPLLAVPRGAVRAYAASRRLAWVEDPTNREPAYLRNRIRKELLPLLERRYRSGLARRLARLAAELRGAAPAARAAPPEPQGAQPAEPADPIRVAFERRAWDGTPSPDGRSVAVFDAEVLIRPVIRAIEPGDRVTPMGMDGSRHVRDVLRDAGIPAAARAARLVVTREDGTVVWVPGAVRSGDAPVNPLTRQVWVFWMEQSAQLRGEPRSVTVEHPEPRPRATTPGTEQDNE